MICKTANISHCSAALNYCNKGGEVLYTNKCNGDPKEINDDFKRLQNQNSRAEKKSIHAIISFNPEDKMEKLTDQDLIDISGKYAKAQGFDQNQYAVYLHKDKKHTHLHIVANRIGEDIKACKDQYSYIKNLNFAKDMELEYKLVPTNRTALDKNKVKDFKKEVEAFKPDNTRAKSIKEVLDICIAKSSSMEQFKQSVEQYDIKVHQGRGIAFSDKDGASVKGSQISREYSLKGIEKQITNKGSSISNEIPLESKQTQTKENFNPRQEPQVEHPAPERENTSIPFEPITPFISNGGSTMTNTNDESDIDELLAKKKKKERGTGR